jgi:transposase
MTDILNLPGWKVTGQQQYQDDFEIQAEYTIKPDTCQKCGTVGRLYKHGNKAVTYRDSPIRGCPVHIAAKVQRYKCRDCGETFLQPLTGIAPGRQMTQRCAEYIAQQSLRDTFTNIGHHIGVNETTVRGVAAEHFQRLNEAFIPPAARMLGIDEVHIGGTARCVFTDVWDRRPVDMLETRDKGAVFRWLMHYPHRAGIEAVTMDMWRPYRDVVTSVMPKMPIVIDKFHVVQLATKGLENVRRRLRASQSAKEQKYFFRSRYNLLKRPGSLTEQQTLAKDMMLANLPEMAEAYELKESLFRIYDLPKADAIKAYADWPKSVPAGMQKDFFELTRAMKNWQPEILAYFDHPITNGYTEAVNGIAKLTNRMGRGYSFEVLRARILFQERREKKAKKVKDDGREWFWNLQLQTYEYQCASCQGMFERLELEIVHESEVTEEASVCHECLQRFHPEDHNYPRSISTR